jgi:CubicO group peptidase (beta-lactamase class C family)
VSVETLFQVGSISKSFAALAVLQNVEAGRLDLHVPVTEYLPWFRLREGTEGVTLHRLLSHTAGIVAGMDATPSTLGEALVLARTTAREPGRFRYSNAGYAVVGLVLEHVTGLPLADVLGRGVLDPAGLGSTAPVVTNALRTRSAVGYEPIDDSGPWRPDLPLAPAPWAETDSAAGSISSTAGDMASYLRLLLARGRGVVSEESFELMLTPASGLDEDGVGYAYGIGVEHLADRRRIGHNGVTPGFSAAIELDLAAGIGVAVLCNRGDCGRFAPREIAEAIRDLAVALADGTEPPPETAWLEHAPPPNGEPAADSAAGGLPDAWRAYLGHYRSHSPWLPGFRVIASRGRLAVRLPGFVEIPLHQLGDETFALADDVEGPATIEFGDLIDGRTARATCDGVDLYRVPWP